MATSSGNAVRLADLLSPQCILLDLRAADREGVLRELAQAATAVMNAPAALDPLVRALLERELLHSTGIGDGVALPHSRNVLSELTVRPVLVFGRHRAGLAFNAIDSQPVHLFFLILATNMSQHLYMLARLSRLLRQKTVRQSLLKADAADEVIDLMRNAESGMP